MLLAIVVAVLVIWQAFVVPEPVVTYPPGDIRNNRSEWIRKFLMTASNYPRRNRSDPSTRVHQHPKCPLVTRHTFVPHNQNSPWSTILSYFCERKPPEIPQPVMGTFGLMPYQCLVCCITRNHTKTIYTVKSIWEGAPCSERMRCDKHGKCNNADLDNLPNKLPEPFWKMVDITWENRWTG
uniref:Secreted protein n=1 Tax=Ixodes ricinus TaxID=34613 RepID=A0A0K8R4R2_IXORI